MNKKVKKGFTLIELLIVVSIIGILSVALVPSITDAPKRARDAARKTMVNTVVAAVESFNLDKGSYPDGTFCVDGETRDSDADNEGELVKLIGGGAPSSTAAVAKDDDDTGCTTDDNTFVQYISTDTGYTVAIKMEKQGTHSCTGAKCTVGADNTYFAVVR